jgi:ATP-dependent protease HslVU (ClpYQ) ATPase subunit
MALTAEQQAEIQLDIDRQLYRINAEIAAGIYEKESQRDLARSTQNAANETRRNKMELVRIAKEVLVENNRSKPVDSRDLSADDITTFAETLLVYVEGE